MCVMEFCTDLKGLLTFQKKYVEKALAKNPQLPTSDIMDTARLLRIQYCTVFCNNDDCDGCGE